MPRSAQQVPADTTMMGVVHDALRRDLSRLEEVLAEVPPPADERRRAIAAHARWLMDFLHRHHSSEDEGLWPLVRRRNPAAGPLLDRMDAEHVKIVPGMEQVRAAAARYGAEGSAVARQALVSALAELSGPLLTHLDDEEVEAMPVVSASITDTEWRDLDQRYNVRGKSLGQLAAEGHWLMDSLDPARYRKLVSLVPAPVRILIEKGYAGRYRRACALRWGPQVAVGRLRAPQRSSQAAAQR